MKQIIISNSWDQPRKGWVGVMLWEEGKGRCVSAWF